MTKNPFRKGATLYIIDRNNTGYGKEVKCVGVADDGKIEVDYGGGWCGYFNINQLKTKYQKEVYIFHGIDITKINEEYFGKLTYKHRGTTNEVISIDKDFHIVSKTLYTHFKNLPKRMKI